MTKLTIKEVKERLLQIDSAEDPFLKMYRHDGRKGVQAAIKQWDQIQEKERALYERYEEMNRYEKKARLAGFNFVAGIDEVGRGPLAGPVVAAAVILNPKKPIMGLNDSKKLSIAKRNELFQEINSHALAIGVGIVPTDIIDQINILRATKMAMLDAVKELTLTPDLLLVDAVKLDTPIAQEVIIKGDMHSNSIMAASIIAKVTRDRMMSEYDQLYPGFNFSSNMGYGTKEHLEGLKKIGVTPIHRKSFSPVTNYIK